MRRAGLEGAGCQRYRLKRQGVPRGSIAFVGLASGWFGRVRKSGNDASCAAYYLPLPSSRASYEAQRQRRIIRFPVPA